MNFPRLIPLFALLACMAARPAHAFHFRAGDGTNALALAAGESLPNETLWIAQSLHVAGRAERDLWLLASAGVRFEGDSAGDLRVLGRSASIDGLARQNLLAYAAGLQLTTNSVVRGQAALFGGTVVCEGTVEGDAWIVAQSVTLGGQWGGNVRIQAEEIRVAPNARIAGNLVYAAPKAPVLDPGVEVGGAVEARRNLMPAASLPAAETRSRFLLHGYLFLAALLVGMPFVGFFPLLAGGAVRSLQARPWRALAAGFLVLFGGPFLAVFCAMTVVGIPLALALGALYALAAYLSHVVVALWIGHAILRGGGPQTFGRVLSALSAGLFALYFASALPGVASFVVLPVLVLGTGALATARMPLSIVALPPPPPPPPFKNNEPTDPPEPQP